MRRRTATRGVPICAWAAVIGVLGGGCTLTDAGERAGGADDRRSARGAVYGRVVRQLALIDHGYGSAPPPYDVIYVLDGIVPSTGAHPTGRAREGRPRAPFPDAIKTAIRHALPDEHVVFTARRADVLTGAPLWTTVGNRGTLVSLGHVRWRNGAAIVPSTRFTASLNAQWATYRLVRRGAGWHVAGTVGGVTIS
jgi:hypothetical protein